MIVYSTFGRDLAAGCEFSFLAKSQGLYLSIGDTIFFYDSRFENSPLRKSGRYPLHPTWFDDASQRFETGQGTGIPDDDAGHGLGDWD